MKDKNTIILWDHKNRNAKEVPISDCFKYITRSGRYKIVHKDLPLQTNVTEDEYKKLNCNSIEEKDKKYAAT